MAKFILDITYINSFHWKVNPGLSKHAATWATAEYVNLQTAGIYMPSSVSGPEFSLGI